MDDLEQGVYVPDQALAKAEAAMSEMFRYFDGGETRGSYD